VVGKIYSNFLIAMTMEIESVDTGTPVEAIMTELFDAEEGRFIEDRVLHPLRGYFETNRIADELLNERRINASLRALLDVERGYVVDLNKEVAMLRGTVADTLSSIKVLSSILV
jgi:hypothetical protein